MRWASWLLGIVGVLQFAIMAYLDPDSYVSLDMSYLVMFLCIIGGLALCYASCYGGYGGYCGPGGGCECCGDDCECGDGPCCAPGEGKGHEHGSGGHEGHSH